MQVAGMQFTTESALAGNDLSTLPDFPAEIRAPAGTLAGVSGFQLNFSSREVFTPGDDLDVLVAMNPAALKVNSGDLRPNGILIVDKETFNEQNLRKAEISPILTDGSLARFGAPGRHHQVDGDGAQGHDSRRAPWRVRLPRTHLGLFHRPIEPTERWIDQRFQKTPELATANKMVLRAGLNYGETAEMFRSSYEVKPARIQPGHYRNLTGNTALALGLVAAAHQARLPLFLGTYPITPASDILHELSLFKNFGVVTFQAEDEIAGVGAALGAAFGGRRHDDQRTRHVPQSETVNLAVSVEPPPVIADIQRGGPSTGLPTKTEQSDLRWRHGRNGDHRCRSSPPPPPRCFMTAFDAVRIAVKYMTPVILLSDGYLANGAEPWLIPKAAELPQLTVEFRSEPTGFYPYLRDPATLSRPWVVPGTPGLEHRIGGIEKEYLSGNVSYAPMNHEQMVRVRARKIAGIAAEIQRVTARRKGCWSWGGAVHTARSLQSPRRSR
jgi:2-oxoglutarate ferredoxin oxidoreductase subunit alpha